MTLWREKEKRSVEQHIKTERNWVKRERDRDTERKTYGGIKR
jgi:hypothetical protein